MNKYLFWILINVVLASLCISIKTATAEQKQTYTVAIDREYAPYEYVNNQGIVAGFTPALLQEIAIDANVKFIFKPLTWPEAVHSLENGSVDFVNMIKTAERTKTYLFSFPHSQVVQAVFRNTKTPKITDLSDLSGLIVGLQDHDIASEKLSSRKDFKIRGINSKLEGLLLLNDRKIDAFICGQHAGINLITEYNFHNIEISVQGLFPQDFSFATRKNNQTLIKILDKGLLKLKESDKLREISEHLLSHKLVADSWFEKNRALLIGSVVFLLILVCCLLFYNTSLSHQIEARKKSEHLLRTNKERYQQIVENTADLILSLDPQHKIIFVNHIGAAIVGLPINELLGQDVFQYIHQDDKPKMALWLDKCISQQSLNSTIEHRAYNMKTGMVTYLSWSASFTYDASGNVTEVRGVGRDITAVKEAAFALEKRITVLTSPESNLTNIVLTDIIGLDVLQTIQDSFSDFSDMPSIIYGLDGVPITKPSNFTDFCTTVRSTEKGNTNCIIFDAALIKEVNTTLKPSVRKGCALAGIYTGTVPIVIEGHHLANWGIGQAITSEIDRGELRTYAARIDIDESTLVSAAHTLKRIPVEDLKKAVAYLDILSQHLSMFCLKNLTQAKNIAARQQAEKETKAVEAELEKTLQSMELEHLLVEEQERRKIAKDLHDHVGQMLAAVKIRQEKLTENISNADDKRFSRESIEMLDQVLGDVRSLTFDLSTFELFRDDIGAAIEGVGKKIFHDTGIAFTMTVNEITCQLTEVNNIVLYKTARELFFNIVKHADARNVTAELAQFDKYITLQVSDDGTGFELLPVTDYVRNEHFGLFNLKENIAAIGAEIEFISTKESGTFVDIKIDINQT